MPKAKPLTISEVVLALQVCYYPPGVTDPNTGRPVQLYGVVTGKWRESGRWVIQLRIYRGGLEATVLVTDLRQITPW